MKMAISNPFIDQFHSLTKKLFPWTLYALLPIALLSLYLYPLPFLPSTESELPHSTSNIIISHSTPPSFASTPPSSEKENTFDTPSCDYFNGKWIRDRRGPLYNGTTCGTIKEGQNCIKHGRPDFDYLYWRWKPSECKLPRFEPKTFLELVENKHIAFVGDSMARNQLESLLCVEKSNEGPNHNKLYLDLVDERWAKDMDEMDYVVLSIGHWFLHPAVYFEGEWDKAGACPKTKPYRDREKVLEGMDGEMRKIEIEEVEDAKVKGSEFGGVRFEALDVTKLALLRPDGHPGPYMYPFPFANGVQERVQNDCVHWCLPGPVDTWNEIFLEIMKKWEDHPRTLE
ncbi:hypothetical protein TSUD_220540 [Trifolium subterraneum]|uniref:Uncharacterized protein n=1 Tax=Trifolium subterraneum TaxID=3900 RepID=A0A2Z6NLZ5_TRISU|nr:hypothetical protein TSUD_220540 [Trifolium subterraneum]